MGFLALCTALRGFVTDDAYISLRYAENLAAGRGFAWNAAGPRVEGFSNPLLVMAEALAVRSGAGGIEAARLLGVGAGLALLVVIHRRAPALVGPTATRAALVLVALFPPLALWAVGGLETLPAALAITVGVLAVCRATSSPRPWRSRCSHGCAQKGRGRARGRRRGAPAAPTGAGGRRCADRLAGAARGGPARGVRPPAPELRALQGGRGRHVRRDRQVRARRRSGGGGWIAGALLARGRVRLFAVPPLVYLLGSLRMLDSADAFGRFMLPRWP